MRFSTAESLAPSAPRLLAPSRSRARALALIALAVTNACDIGFLLFDPRNPTFAPWLATLFLAGGAGYAAALALVWKRIPAGLVLAGLLAPASAFVVAVDNFVPSPSDPTPLVFALNFLFLVAQPALVVAAWQWHNSTND